MQATSLAELFRAGAVRQGSQVRVTLPPQYKNNTGGAYSTTGEIVEKGQIAWNGQRFATLPEFHQAVKVARVTELRKQNQNAPRTPGLPYFSSAAKTTEIDGQPLMQILRTTLIGGDSPASPPSEEDVIDRLHEAAYPGSAQDSATLADPSLDPFNDDCDSLPDESVSLSEHFLDVGTDSQAPSVEFRKPAFPPQEVVSDLMDEPSFHSSEESPSIQMMSQLPDAQPQSDSFRLEEIDAEDTPPRSVGSYVPQTAEMLGFADSSSSLSHADSTEIRRQYQEIPSERLPRPVIPPAETRKSPPTPLSPAREKLMAREAAQKINKINKERQAFLQKSPEVGSWMNKRTSGKRKRTSPEPPSKGTPVISEYFPPKKIARTNNGTTSTPARYSRLTNDGVEVVQAPEQPEICSVSSEDSDLIIQPAVAVEAPSLHTHQSLSDSVDPPQTVSSSKPTSPSIQGSPLPPSTHSTPSSHPIPTSARSNSKAETLQSPAFPKPGNTRPQEISDASSSDYFPSPPPAHPAKGNKPLPNSSSPVILTTGLTATMTEQIRMLIKKIGSGELVKQFSEQVTHLVVFCDSDGMPKTTIKFHQCILAGCHVVSFTWILSCFRDQKWLPEKDFVAKGHRGIIEGRRTRLTQAPRLFVGYSFCLWGTYSVPSKSDIRSLIRAGHGTLLDELPGIPANEEEALAHENTLILCHPDTSEKEAEEVYYKCGLHPLAVHYILDWITQYTLLNSKFYRFLDSDEQEGEEPSTNVPMSLAF